MININNKYELIKDIILSTINFFYKILHVFEMPRIYKYLRFLKINDMNKV
jgi:tRNA A22 N-methylase